ncbi:S24 family peptidase [Pseudohoeflea coraliihabitans]|uniref:Helix-turn-helix transcriptional regulator n=1 Tax=Pseudohoeflea coraliihabitans TaxID=2860393 RepID=A0ABS6WND3_9HYPH|nr:helix-turn-helix transcriptional regulator [Pseudohoeflea sp. DP4N28-3]MBW3097466.1 helix-turn-helix transcriptional regulator [Pseudohoeflea sp. DP4N28-3]
MLSHDRIWEAIDRLAASHGLTASGLARRAGLDPTSFNKSKRCGSDGRARWPSTESLSKVLQATGSSLDAFFELNGAAAHDHADAERSAGEGKQAETGKMPESEDLIPHGLFPPQQSSIPLLGFAQAGAGGFFDDGGFPAGQGWDMVDFPAHPSAGTGVYALEVQGDSMMPLYRDGDILIVEPGAQVRRGDRVVVRSREGEVMAKVLQRNGPRGIELTSLNPDHPNRSFKPSEIDWMARIVWASQ